MEEKGYGWILFASIMLVVAGAFNFIWGITALARDQYFINQVLFANLTFWGWVTLIWGVILVIAGFSILTKEQWARWFGIFAASISMIFMFMVLWAYPVGSVVIIAIDVMVIYGLGQYGGNEISA